MAQAIADRGICSNLRVNRTTCSLWMPKIGFKVIYDKVRKTYKRAGPIPEFEAGAVDVIPEAAEQAPLAPSSADASTAGKRKRISHLKLGRELLAQGATPEQIKAAFTASFNSRDITDQAWIDKRTTIYMKIASTKANAADSRVITVLVKGNPKRVGAACHSRFNLYEDGMTVAEYLAAGGTRGDIAWDTKHGFVCVEEERVSKQNDMVVDAARHTENFDAKQAGVELAHADLVLEKVTHAEPADPAISKSIGKVVENHGSASPASKGAQKDVLSVTPLAPSELRNWIKDSFPQGSNIHSMDHLGYFVVRDVTDRGILVSSLRKGFRPSLFTWETVESTYLALKLIGTISPFGNSDPRNFLCALFAYLPGVERVEGSAAVRITVNQQIPRTTSTEPLTDADSGDEHRIFEQIGLGELRKWVEDLFRSCNRIQSIDHRGYFEIRKMTTSGVTFFSRRLGAESYLPWATVETKFETLQSEGSLFQRTKSDSGRFLCALFSNLQGVEVIEGATGIRRVIRESVHMVGS